MQIPLSGHHRHRLASETPLKWRFAGGPIEMVFRWRADDDQTMNAGLVALRFFRGSGPVLLRNLAF